jgi:fatty acid desaturase
VSSTSGSHLLTKDELKALTEINAVRVWGSLAGWWLTVVGAIFLGIWLGLSLWLVPLIIVIGCLQNALILWTHEGSHGNLHRDLKRNDVLADLLICGPLGVTVDGYRWHHSRHHKYLGDPQQEIELSAFACIRGGQLWTHIGRHMFGAVAYGVIFRRNRFEGHNKFPQPPPRSPAAWIGFVALNGALFLSCILLGAWWAYFALWVFPLFTISIMVSNFRTIVEHQPSSDVCDSGDAAIPAIVRIVTTNWLERTLVAPIGFYYHYEHHLYPKVPYHNLPAVRAALKAHGHYSEETVRANGFVRTIWNLSRDPEFQRRWL